MKIQTEYNTIHNIKEVYLRAKEAPQEQPNSALGLSMILNEERISSV